MKNRYILEIIEPISQKQIQEAKFSNKLPVNVIKRCSEIILENTSYCGFELNDTYKNTPIYCCHYDKNAVEEVIM